MDQFETVFKLLRYDENSGGPLPDAISEIAAILDKDVEEAGRLTKQMLDNYHYGVSELPTDMPHEIFMIILMVAQTFRIPSMTERMAPLLEQLGDIHDKTVLDYGAGGGKDTIIFAKLAKSVTYADLPDLLTAYVTKRFQIRGLGNIQMVDVRRMDSISRYDIVNCMDVVEHVYDTEYVVADLIARTKKGGHILCWPCFVNSWNGDHIEKNCGYLPYFTDMLLAVGLEPVSPVPIYDFATSRGLKPTGVVLYHLRRTRLVSGSVAEEREGIRKELYRLSLRFSDRTMRWCSAALPFAKIFRKDLAGTISDNLFDNYAINRLSKHQLAIVEASKTA